MSDPGLNDLATGLKTRMDNHQVRAIVTVEITPTGNTSFSHAGFAGKLEMLGALLVVAKYIENDLLAPPKDQVASDLLSRLSTMPAQ